MSENRPPFSPPPSHNPLRSPVMFDDLTADLLWPRLLRAGALALRPSRVGLAFFYLVGLAALVSIADRVDGVEGNALLTAGQEWVVHLWALIQNAWQADADGVGQAINGLFVGAVWGLVGKHPVIAIVFLPIILIWTTLIGGAISRIAAMDFAQGVGLSWPEGTGYALGRWTSFAGSIGGPLALVYGIALALAIGGWALFSISGVNVVGGVLWVLFLLASLVAAVIMVAMTLGGPMLVPAVACEGTDAIDAVQHVYSYVFAKPLRLLLYIGILAIQFVLLAIVVGAVIWLVIHFARHAAGIWVGPEADTVMLGSALVQEGQEASKVDAAAASLVAFWTGIPVLLGMAFAVSYFWCAATVLYLCMRRICDGQDISEVWVDTIVPGTMAQRHPARPAPLPPAHPVEAVRDNGPADEG